MKKQYLLSLMLLFSFNLFTTAAFAYKIPFINKSKNLITFTYESSSRCIYVPSLEKLKHVKAGGEGFIALYTPDNTPGCSFGYYDDSVRYTIQAFDGKSDVGVNVGSIEWKITKGNQESFNGSIGAPCTGRIESKSNKVIIESCKF